MNPQMKKWLSVGRNLQILLLILLHLLSYSESCRLLRAAGLTCQDKQIIVDTHNKLRQLVALGLVTGQPSAINMLQMSWDEELAAQAQAWANKCTFQHDKGRTLARFSVGQNMATSWSSPTPSALGQNPDFATQIKNWFNEVYTYGFHGSYSHNAGHYSQVVWGDTYLVGCGYSYYLEGSKYTKLYVCNYGPAGNVLGTSPYRKGSPSCTLRGTTPSTKYYGLCEVQGYLTNPCYYG